MFWQHFAILGGLVCQGVRLNVDHDEKAATCSAPLVHWNLCDKIMQVHSNLEGIGPNTTGLHEFRVPEIAKLGDTSVDLVVTAVAGGGEAANGKKYNSERVKNGKWGGGAYVSKTEPPKGTAPHYPIAKSASTTHVWGTGIGPCWIALPWLRKTYTKFHWKFVKTGTSEEVQPKSFSLRIADFDAHTAGDTEYVQFNTPPSTILPGTGVLHTQANGVQQINNKFEGKVTDNPTRDVKHPCTAAADDPYSCMTDDQKARSVEVSYQAPVFGADITFGAAGDTQGDRAFQIYGKICPDPPPACPCTEVVHWNLCDKIQQVHSNLDGIGPNKTGANEFRVPEVGQLCGQKVDLRVTVVDGGGEGAPNDQKYSSERVKNGKWGGGAYVSKTEPPKATAPHYPIAKSESTTHVWGTGIGPCWIALPWLRKTNTKFHWGFVTTGTNTPATPENFTIRIADFDAHTTGDAEYVQFNTPPSAILPGSGVLQTQVNGVEQIKNQLTGKVTDNPTRDVKHPCTVTANDPYSCMTDDNKARSVEVSYSKKSGADITFGAYGETQGDRALQIYGKICKS